MDEEHTVVDALQLVEELVYLVQKSGSLFIVGDEGIYHLVVTLQHGIVFFAIVLVAVLGH